MAGLIQATDGSLYGTTYAGGTNHYKGVGSGTVFSLSPSGVVKKVYDFCGHGTCDEWGGEPVASLLQGLNGNFYGSTPYGGNRIHGTVFDVTPGGILATLVDFDGWDGMHPESALIQATNSDFYGTTLGGGKHGCYWPSYGCGTVFKMEAEGALTTLYRFCSQANCTDGENPAAGVIQGTDGNLYGTTEFGGANGGGTLFTITPSGTLTTLYSFCAQTNCTDGANPLASLLEAADGNFYGTTSAGGANGDCGTNSGCGTIFKLTPDGVLTTLYSFCSQAGCADGEGALSPLIQGTDGNLYGTTSSGGTNGAYGTIFQITTTGTFTMVYSFCSQAGCTDGGGPYGGLVQDTNGDFYGTTWGGGANGPLYGTIFSLSMGLGPFVTTQPGSAGVAAPVNILGSSLKGATSVTFNGAPAEFAVSSQYLIKAYVPSGATTGPVQVVTPGGTLTSNVPFRVLP